MKKIEVAYWVLAGVMVGIIIGIIAGNGGFDTSNEVVQENDSPYVWVDDYRLHKDSIPNYSPIFNEELEQHGIWIKWTHKGDADVFIECLDTDDHTYQEFKTSFVMAFREGLKDARY